MLEKRGEVRQNGVGLSKNRELLYYIGFFLEISHDATKKLFTIVLIVLMVIIAVVLILRVLEFSEMGGFPKWGRGVDFEMGVLTPVGTMLL